MSYEPTTWKKGDKVTSTKLNKIEQGIQGNDSEIGELKSGFSELSARLLNAFPTDIASGSIASFSDGADNLPLKSLVVNINPVQDLHGQENPYPAGGGKNQWDEEWELGIWDATGSKANNSNAIRSKGYIPVSPKTEYYLYIGTRYTAGLVIRVLDSNKSFVSTITLNQSKAFTIPSGGAFIVFCTYASNNITVYNNDIAINYPSTVTTYSPYSNICPISGWTGMQLNANGTVIPISWQTEAGTVYGGKLDVLTGKLTVDRATVDLGTLTWYAATAQRFNRFRAPVIGIKKIDSPNVLGAIVCSSYAAKTANQTYTGSLGISLQQNANDVYIYDPQKEAFSAADFKSAMSGVQLVYELATPQTYQLTPTEVATLLGDNTIWADTGDTEVEYRANTELWVQRKITEAVAAVLNS